MSYGGWTSLALNKVSGRRLRVIAHVLHCSPDLGHEAFGSRNFVEPQVSGLRVSPNGPCV